MRFLAGGNWADFVDVGRFSLGYLRVHHEIYGVPRLELDGLPERWIRILEGETLRRQIIKIGRCVVLEKDWKVQWERQPCLEEDMGGLPDRWVKIKQMEVAKIILEEPEVHVTDWKW